MFQYADCKGEEEKLALQLATQILLCQYVTFLITTLLYNDTIPRDSYNTLVHFKFFI